MTSLIHQLTFLLLFSMSATHAQRYFCGHSEAEHQQVQLPNVETSHLRIAAGETIYYPIQAHILKKTEDTAATTSIEVVKAIAKLNKNFEVAHIQFYMPNPIQYIVDSFYVYKSLYETKLSSKYCRAGFINIFFVKEIMHYVNGPNQYPNLPIGLAPIGGASSNPILIDGDYVWGDNLLTHELGHYFSLQHMPQDGSGNYMQPATFEGPASFTATQLTAISTETATRWKTSMAKSSVEAIATPSDLTASFMEFSKVKLTWKDNANNELGYVVERSSRSDSGFTQIDFVDINAQEVYDYQLESNTVYYYRIKAGNSSAYSSVASIKTGISYCHPQNEAKCAGMIPDLSIKAFTIKNVPYTINSKDDCSGYSYVYPAPLALKADSAYAFSVTMYATAAQKDVAFYNKAVAEMGGGTPGWNPSNVQYKSNILIWIDLNENGVFEASEKMYEGLVGKNATVITGSLLLPKLAKPIKTLMRIRAVWKASIFYTNTNIMKILDPCLPHTEGETEDYVVEIGDIVTALESPEAMSKSGFYPNPSTGKLMLHTEIVECEILDLSGNVLAQFKNSPSDEISLPDLANGVYLIHLEHTDGQCSFDKLLIER